MNELFMQDHHDPHKVCAINLLACSLVIHQALISGAHWSCPGSYLTDGHYMLCSYINGWWVNRDELLAGMDCQSHDAEYR